MSLEFRRNWLFPFEFLLSAIRSKRTSIRPFNRAAARRSASQFLRHSPERKVACFLLAGILLMWPLPSIFVNELRAGASCAASEVSYLSKGGVELVSELLRALLKKKRGQDTLSDRLAHVSSISVSPIKYVAHVGQAIPFTSVPLDYAGRTVQGVRFSYSSSDPSKLEVNEMGLATCLEPGVVWVTSKAGTVTAKVPVLVLPGSRRIQSDAEWDAEQGRLSPNGAVAAPSGGRVADAASALSSIGEKLSPTVYAQSGGADSGDFGYDELWSDLVSEITFSAPI